MGVDKWRKLSLPLFIKLKVAYAVEHNYDYFYAMRGAGFVKLFDELKENTQ